MVHECDVLRQGLIRADTERPGRPVMGRKLTALEDAQSALTDSDLDRQEYRAQLRQDYLERIADQLGVTTAQLSELPDPSSAIQPAIDAVRQSELVLAQQCRDLVEAFLRIQDPQDRLRYLQIVRDAALTK